MAHSLLKERTTVDKCLYQFSLDSDDEITDLLTPPTHFVEFEIAHGVPNSIFEEHEIIRIHSVPTDCDLKNFVTLLKITTSYTLLVRLSWPNKLLNV